MKKFFNGLLAAAVAVSVVATPALASGEATFTDVSGAYGETAILQLHALGAINGYPDGDFHPQDNVTRAQFALILTNALGYGKTAEAMKSMAMFSDLAGYDWAAGAINLAASKGWISGYGDGKFGPADPITDEQMASILVRAAGVKLEASEPWFISGVLASADLGIADDEFAIGTPATRAQVAVSTVNFLKVPVNAAGIYNADTGNARVTTKTWTVTAAGKLTDGTLTIDVPAVPTYGTVVEGAKVLVTSKAGTAVMANVVNNVKTLALTEAYTDYVIVRENGVEKAYLTVGDFSALTVGFYDFVFNADGKITNATANTAFGGDLLTSAKKVIRNNVATYTITLNGKTYNVETSGTWLTLQSTINGLTVATDATNDTAWALLKAGDKVTIDSQDIDGNITAMTVVRSTFDDATVKGTPSGSKLVVTAGTTDITLDVRVYTDLSITKDGVAVAYNTLKAGDVVDLTINPTTTKIVGVKFTSAATDSLAGKFISEVVTTDGVTTITINGTTYELASGATLTALVATGNEAVTGTTVWTDLTDRYQVTASTITSGKIAALTVYYHDLSGSIDNKAATADYNTGELVIVRTVSFDGGTTNYELAADAVITLDGNTAAFKDLTTDGTTQNVDLVFNKDGKVVRVLATTN